MDIGVLGHEIEYTFGMYLRYNCRLELRPYHRAAIAKPFGCAATVWPYAGMRDGRPRDKECAR